MFDGYEFDEVIISIPNSILIEGHNLSSGRRSPYFISLENQAKHFIG